MTSVERLVANCNSIVNFLREFSSDIPQDISIDWVNDDGSITTKTFSNIRKFQESINILNKNNILKSIDNGELTIDNALKLDGKTLNEIMELVSPKGSIIEFMLIKNGKQINFANDPIDDKALSKGFELFCPHNREEYEMARRYLLALGEPKSMGPLGIYYDDPNIPSSCCTGCWHSYHALNSDDMGKLGWKVQDGSPTWWASDRTNVSEPNGDYTARAYLNITYDNNGYITWYNDAHSSYKYTTYLCVRRKK